MTIRLAEMSDLEVLCRLYVAFHEFHVRGVPTRLLSLGDSETYDCTDLFKTLAELLADPDAALFVADVDGRIVGLAEVYLRQDEPSSARVAYQHGYLQSLMVDPTFRGCGVGTQLVRATEDWAKARGAAEMRLETWEFPAGPLPFYVRVGYTTLRRTLIRPLGIETEMETRC
jgi:GNAT superfamily N-acetyltransferase